MEQFTKHNEDLTLLITHFNRSESLKRLLTTLRKYGITFNEIIVSDGGSKPEHLNPVIDMKTEFGFNLLTTEVNKGLGNSINVGNDAAKTPYILYIQEDFVPKAAFGPALQEGLSLIKSESQWDIIRFYSFPWAPFPYLKPYKGNFSEMIFSLWPWYTDHVKFYVYSDHPHIKRKTFSEKFGRYIETLSGDITEMGMCRTFLKKKGRGLYFTHFENMFEHANDDNEPGQFRPEKEGTKKYSDIGPLYWLYLRYKLLKETASFVLSK